MRRRSRRLHAVADLNDRLISFLVGVLDGCLFFSYLFNFEQAYFYAGAIGLKLVIALHFRRMSWSAMWPAIPFSALLLVAETASGVVNGLEVVTYIKVVFFVLNILTTLSFVSAQYWQGLFLANVGNALIYVVLFYGGQIEGAFGRYFYYNRSHPNLGSELLFGASFAGLLSKRPRYVLLLLPLILFPVIMMQGRAAQLGITMVALICAIYVFRSLSLGPQAAILMVAALGLTIFLLSVDIGALLNKWLLLDDKYRGEGTDASGRSTYWAAAIQVWMDHPFFGAGSNYPARLGVLQAHNFFLYGLANYGVLGGALLSVFLYQLGSVAVAGYWPLILPLVPMLVFNDRFINLNTYPTAMFLFVFAYHGRTFRLGSPSQVLRGSIRAG